MDTLKHKVLLDIICILKSIRCRMLVWLTHKLDLKMIRKTSTFPLHEALSVFPSLKPPMS